MKTKESISTGVSIDAGTKIERDENGILTVTAKVEVSGNNVELEEGDEGLTAAEESETGTAEDGEG